MTLGAPLGLVALVAAPALIALYFLRRRQPPRKVSALFLWRSPDQRSEAGPRLQKFSRELSLLLELGAVVAVALFLADLRCGARAVERHTVLVLDGSLSMSARQGDGKTAAERALERAKKIADQDGGKVTVIESGVRPKLRVGPAAEYLELATLSFEPAGPHHDFGPALVLARELAGPQARVRLLTDRLLEPPPAGVEVIALGQSLPNDAFVAVARRDVEGRALVSLRVAHYGPERAQVPVEIRTLDGRVLHSERLALGPNEERGIRLTLPYAEDLLARLPDDALLADNAAVLPPNPVRPLKIRSELPEGMARLALARFLKAESTLSEGEPADLVFAPPGPNPKPWTVVVGLVSAPQPSIGPYFSDRNHPLFENVPLEGLLWAVDETSAPGRPLLTAGRTVVVSEAPGPVFHLRNDLARSNLHRTAAWPVLLANLLELRRDASPGFPRRILGLGDEVSVNIEGEGPWAFAGAGEEMPLRTRGALRLAAPSRPGRYELKQDGQPTDWLQGVAVERAEADLTGAASGRTESDLSVGTLSPSTEGRSPWPLLAMLALLCADWLLTSALAPRARSREVAA